MYTTLMVIQVLLCIVLVALVLVQKGQGADIGAVFGGGASQTVFGARGAGNFLSHITAIVGALFFLNSLGLAYLSDHSQSSVVSGIALPSTAPMAAPVTPSGNKPATSPAVAPAASALAGAAASAGGAAPKP
ncbi:MAG: preprotein translocase subunit SecG [Acidithiobacillus sp.]|jgi:preprotein translocase subunit SecG|uniref:preprotein translocase subunit SecG n=1 Tax=Acidithiobacillus sp. TaxID=1872118 RepID=UPI003CFD1CF6